MEEYQSKLQQAILDGKNLIKELRTQIDPGKLNQFEAICQSFCELEAKFQLAKMIENNNIPEIQKDMENSQ